MPERLVRPTVGRRPTSWLNDDGTRIEPPVSVPKPSAARFAATDAPVPPDEPPEVLLVPVGRYGLYTFRDEPAAEPKLKVDDVLIANSSMLALARMIAWAVA